MLIKLDGRTIHSEDDFHLKMASLLDFGPYYGKNLDAFYDRLSTDVERPLTLIWEYSGVSKEKMGDSYEVIVSILERVQRQDQEWNFAERFTFELR